MAQTTGDFGTFRFSTEGVPEADRVAVWREEFGRMARLDVEAPSDAHFHSDLTMRILPGLGLVTVRTRHFVPVGRGRCTATATTTCSCR